MCYHISLVFSNKVNITEISEIYSEYNMEFIPLSCYEELSEIRTNTQCFRPFNRHCDCDTPLGLKQRRTKKRIPQDIEDNEELLLWFEFLKEILENKAVWWIGLFIHWLSDPISIKRREKVYVEELTKENLLNLEIDVFYEFLLLS